MVFETELSDKLNNELESAGISVSEALIAKTLAAVQAARAEEKETSETEWVEASEDNINKLIELAQARKGRFKGAGQILFRTATVMAACLVLVAGAFALRFSTMRMGKDAAQAPMAAAENGSARNGITYAADADGVVVESEDFKLFNNTTESLVEEPAAAARGPQEMPMDSVALTAESNPTDDAEECVTEASDIQEEVKLLTEQLVQAESVGKELTAQGTSVYRFAVRDAAGATVCYLVHENGMVEFAEMTAAGETGAVWSYGAAEDKTFRRSLLVWMKQNGYEFDAE